MAAKKLDNLEALKDTKFQSQGWKQVRIAFSTLCDMLGPVLSRVAQQRPGQIGHYFHKVSEL